MNTQMPQQGLFDTAVQKTGLGNFAEKFNISKSTLIEIGMYLGIGFVVGFLLKRGSHLFLILVLTMLILWFLHHVSLIFIVINWQKIQELVFGAQSINMNVHADLGSNLWGWITNHVAGSISFVIGFLAGIRLG